MEDTVLTFEHETVPSQCFKAQIPSFYHPINFGALESAPALMKRRCREGKNIIVVDVNTRHIVPRLPVEGDIIEVPIGENAKSLSVASNIFAQLRDMQVSRRSSLIIGVGGGAICDLVGSTSMLYMRGVRYGLIPTTLLGMADAAIGSKVALNGPNGTKNLLGGFYPPRFVHIDINLLETLEDRQYLSGFAEVVKVALLAEDQGIMFSNLELNWHKIQCRDRQFVTKILQDAISIKMRLVVPDILERNLDRVLNLGHALGHAVEAASDYALLHGEAVAIGLARASRLGVERGLCSVDLANRIEALLIGFSLPTQIPGGCSPERILDELQAVALVRDGDLRVVIPIEPGRACIIHDVKPHELLGDNT